MTVFETKRQQKRQRLEERIAKLEKVAKDNDLSLFGEARSGIPLGQPILVGHHSERRHRRHLEQLHAKFDRGVKASKLVAKLRERLEAMDYNTSIQVDNPDAKDLLEAKLSTLTKQRDTYKVINTLIRRSKGDVNTLTRLIETDLPGTADAGSLALEMLTPDFAGRVGIPGYRLTNLGAEIRRLKKRLLEIEKIHIGFPRMEIGDVVVELVDGQIQVEFPDKPSEEIRKRLKSHPLSLKWSNYSRKWVRKHTDTTASPNYKRALEGFLNELRDQQK